MSKDTPKRDAVSTESVDQNTVTLTAHNQSFSFIDNALTKTVSLEKICQISKNSDQKKAGIFKQINVSVAFTQGVTFNTLMGKVLSAVVINVQNSKLRANYDDLKDMSTYNVTFSEPGVKLVKADKYVIPYLLGEITLDVIPEQVRAEVEELANKVRSQIK